MVFGVGTSKWFKPAIAMIDERLNFNQNGACSVFGEVNRLISQPVLPSSLSFAAALFFSLSTWPLHTTLTRHPSPFHRHLSPALFSPPLPYGPQFPSPLASSLTWRLPNSLLHTPPPTYTISNSPWSHEEEHQSAPSARLISHSIRRHKTRRWEQSASIGYSYALGFLQYCSSTSLYHGR